MSVLPNSHPGLIERLGLTRAEVARSVWAVDGQGGRWEGAAALNRILQELGGGWALFAHLHRVPSIARKEEAAYRWVSRNRGRLSRFGVPPEVNDG